MGFVFMHNWGGFGAPMEGGRISFTRRQILSRHQIRFAFIVHAKCQPMQRSNCLYRYFVSLRLIFWHASWLKLSAPVTAPGVPPVRSQ